VSKVKASQRCSSLFREDVQHWHDVWIGASSDRPGLLEAARLTWTHQPIQATALLRLAAFFHQQRVPVLPGLCRRFNIMVNGLDVASSVPIGGGLYIPHTVGTVVMAKSIGRRVTLVSNVTIGMRNTVEFPTIGNNVYIGAGARILGAITIGDGAVIGANAVVMSDVPEGALAVGVPARIIMRGESQTVADPLKV
jgi:serine O-acetyltransferase